MLAAAAEALQRGEAVALVTVVRARGSTPQRAGAKMLVYADGRTVGTIGGGCYENDACGKAREALVSGRQALLHYELNDDFAQENGLICGGQMDVHVDPLAPAPRLYIVGAGHVGWHLGRLAADTGFRVHVIDDREKFANAERFPNAQSITVEPIGEWLYRADIPTSACVVVVTRGHQHDLDALRALAPRELRYLGLIGSRAKVARIRAALLAEGMPPGCLDRVHAPIGLDIGAVTPAEIAVSILAQLIAVLRGSDLALPVFARSDPMLIRNATILTMNDRLDVVEGAVFVRGGRIVSVGPEPAMPVDTVINAGGAYLLPGFVQTHVHLCQTLFRSFADDLPLLEWLRRRVWPLEAAHTPATLAAATRLASAELLLTGTTTVLTMETVHDTDVVFEALTETGLRATVGKCMMDHDDQVPARLHEETQRSLDESLALRKRWDGGANGRLRAAFAPRFAVSCSRELLEAVATLSARDGVLVHTHASESQDEIEVVRRLSGGQSNIEYLAATGLASPRLCAAHCVWVSDREQALMADHSIKVLHCPGSNLKLGSGLAPVVEMRRRGISVSLGADGAACNNRLDMFDEMRLAATLQALRRVPGALTARDALCMATREGATALGLEREIGSIEPGKRADLILIDRNRPHLSPDADPWSSLVYAARGTDVRMTMVDGEVLVSDFELVHLDGAGIAAEARAAARELAGRASIR